MPGEQVHECHQQRSEDRAHNPPAERLEAEDLDAERDDQLGQRRLGIEVVAPEQVVVRVIGEIELVKDIRGAGGNGVRRVTDGGPHRGAGLVLVAYAPGRYRRAGPWMAEEIEEEGTAEAEEGSDEGQRDEPAPVSALQPQPDAPRHPL